MPYRHFLLISICILLPQLLFAQFSQGDQAVSVSYKHVQFENRFAPWTFLTLNYQNTTDFGKLMGEMQYARRFNKNGIQFGIDAYPDLTEDAYAYLSARFSRADIYPRTRLAGSINYSLPAGFVTEGGASYYNFINKTTTVFTGSIRKYFPRYLLTGRIHWIPSKHTEDSFNFSLKVRRYLSTPRKYIGLAGGYGTASGEIRFAQDIEPRKSWFVKLRGRFPLLDLLYLEVATGYEWEEFKLYDRKRYDIEATVEFPF